MVGPQEALELLKRNIHNRKISESVVDKYVIEMQMGEWLPVCAGIGIDEKGVLTDGQQRLLAITRYGKQVPLLITTGLPVASQEKADRQRKRTLADVFYLSGECKKKVMVEAATYLARKNSTQRRYPADAEVRAAINTHRESLEVICELLSSNKKGVCQVGVRAALTLAHEMYPEKTVVFADRIQSDLHSRNDDPALRLRRVLTGETGARRPGTHCGTGNQDWVFKKTMYAVNAFIQNRNINSVLEDDDVVVLSNT